jgi:dihydroorotase
MMPLIIGIKSYQGTTQGNVGTFDLSHEGLYNNLTTYAKLRARGGMRQPLALHAREEIGYETAEFMMRKYGQAVYWCHVSTETEVDYAQRLQRDFPDLFDAEATLHHMTMTQVDARTHYGWLGARMQPPLGKENDFEKVLWAFNQGILSTLGTDHAPHPNQNKINAEEQNPQASEEAGCVSCYGVSGIKFVLPVLFAMIKRGETTIERAIDALHTQPHKVIDLKPRNTRTILEIETYRIGEDDNMGNSRNTPYINWTGGAKVRDVVVDGVSRFVHSKRNTQVILPRES